LDTPLALGRKDVGFLPRPLGFTTGISTFLMRGIQIANLVARIGALARFRAARLRPPKWGIERTICWFALLPSGPAAARRVSFIVSFEFDYRATWRTSGALRIWLGRQNHATITVIN
jgi:hypothetical protein